MRCVFQAMAGFLGRVDSETRCAFWAEEPADHGFDPGRLIAVDLARTPAAAAAKQIGWSEVQVERLLHRSERRGEAVPRSGRAGPSCG